MTIKDMRTSKKLTQEQVAESLGVKQSYYSRIERGDANPTIGKLVKLAELYDQQADQLVAEFIRSAEARGKRWSFLRVPDLLKDIWVTRPAPTFAAVA